MNMHLMMARARMNHAGGLPPPPLPIVTWDPATKGSRLTLSGGNLIETNQQGLDGFTGTSLKSTASHPSTDVNGFYAEIKHTIAGPGNYSLIGLCNTIYDTTGAISLGDANSWGYYEQTGEFYHAGATASIGTSWGVNDVIGVFIRSGKVWFSKNDVWQGAGSNPNTDSGPAFTGVTGEVFIATSIYFHSDQMVGRFKASDFTGTIPTGASAWGS